MENEFLIIIIYNFFGFVNVFSTIGLLSSQRRKCCEEILKREKKLVTSSIDPTISKYPLSKLINSNKSKSSNLKFFHHLKKKSKSPISSSILINLKQTYRKSSSYKPEPKNP